MRHHPLARRLICVAAWISAMAFVFLLAFCIRSFFVADLLYLGRDPFWKGDWGRAYRLDSGAGCIAFVIDDTVPAAGQLGRGWRWNAACVDPRWVMADRQPFMGTLTRQWHFAGFGWALYQGYPPLSSFRPFGNPPVTSLPILGHRYIVPYWALLVLTAVPVIPAIRHLLARRRQARHLRLGLCAQCGYDLRASTTRCPECGTPIPPDRSV